MGEKTSDADVDLLPLLAKLQREFHEHLITADEEVAVPSCGTWTVRDLAEHLSGVYVWAAGMTRGEKVDRPEGHPEDLAASFRTRAAHLHQTLTEVGPDAPCRIFGGEGSASFWRRRQVHETLVHLHDLAEALGAPTPEAPAHVWADGVDEIIHVLHPRQVRLGRAEPPSSPVRLTAYDAGVSWTFPADAEGPAAEIRGRARDLVLLFWGRSALGDSPVEVRGDRAAVQEVLRQSVTP